MEVCISSGKMNEEIFEMVELAGMSDLTERLVRLAKVREKKKPNKNLIIIKQLFL